MRAMTERVVFKWPILYYRLAVFPVEVPPLRERSEDIALLAQHFVGATQLSKSAAVYVSPSELARLRTYDWPGNVRELQNVVQRALITQSDGVLAFDVPSRTSGSVGQNPGAEVDSVLTDVEMKEFERRNIELALKTSAGRVSGRGGAAELLGVRPTTLASRMKRLAIRKP